MAVVLVPDQNRRIDNDDEIARFLSVFGIFHEVWQLEERVNPEAPAEDILRAYGPEIDRLKKQGGYVTADVINVTPQTPGLEAMMAKYRSEHTHSEDEVRFILKGRGLFHIHPKNGPVFAIQVEAGDLINVPKGTLHWFDLCADRTIRAIRLFQDPAGWVPSYSGSGVQEKYQPVCWSPTWGVNAEK